MNALLLSTLLALAPPSYSDGLSADQAARQAEARYGGQVLDIRAIQTANGNGYRIKLLQPSGRVKLLVIDQQEGGNDRGRRGNSGKGKGSGKH